MYLQFLQQVKCPHRKIRLTAWKRRPFCTSAFGGSHTTLNTHQYVQQLWQGRLRCAHSCMIRAMLLALRTLKWMKFSVLLLTQVTFGATFKSLINLANDGSMQVKLYMNFYWNDFYRRWNQSVIPIKMVRLTFDFTYWLKVYTYILVY